MHIGRWRIASGQSGSGDEGGPHECISIQWVASPRRPGTPGANFDEVKIDPAAYWNCG